MAFKFEELRVWKEAMDLAEVFSEIVMKFPKHETFNLSSQLMRAIDSVALNISEGSIGQTDPENKRFLSYAIRSCCEVITCLHKAKRRNYITEKQFEELYNRVEILFKMLNKYRNSLD